jgi:hypothetical protein
MYSTVVKGHLGEAPRPFHTTEFGCVFHMSLFHMRNLTVIGEVVHMFHPQEGTSHTLSMIIGDVCHPCGKESVGLIRRRCIYRRSLTHRNSVDNGAGASLSGEKVFWDGGESVGLARKLIPVM